MLFLSDRFSSVLAHAPVNYEELLQYLGRLYHLPASVIQLHTEALVPVTTQSALDPLVQKEDSTITLRVTTLAGMDTDQADYILGFADRRKLRLLRLEDNEVSFVESDVLHWTGRACLFGPDAVLFTGGQEYPEGSFQISLSDQQSTELGTMQEGRIWHGLCTLGRKTFALGGRDPVSGLSKQSAETLENGNWTVICPLNCARESMAVTVHCATVYVVGGFDGSSRLSSIEAYKEKQWVLLPTQLPEPRQMPGIVFLSDKKILVVGGQDEEKAQKTVYELCLDSGKAEVLPSLPVPDYFTGRQLVKKTSGEVWGFGKQTYIYFPKVAMWATASVPTRVNT